MGCCEFVLGVGEADQEAGAPSGVQGVQGQSPETSEEMQVSWDWWEEEQGRPAVLIWLVCLMKDPFDFCLQQKREFMIVSQ